MARFIAALHPHKAREDWTFKTRHLDEWAQQGPKLYYAECRCGARTRAHYTNLDVLIELGWQGGHIATQA